MAVRTSVALIAVNAVRAASIGSYARAGKEAFAFIRVITFPKTLGIFAVIGRKEKRHERSLGAFK